MPHRFPQILIVSIACAAISIVLIGHRWTDKDSASESSAIESDSFPMQTAADPSSEPDDDSEIQFSRDIRPILSSKCFKCHGPDENAREADLRLDREEDAKADRGGFPAIVEGDPAASELIYRIDSHDSDERMPPENANLSLDDNERRLLTRWIAAGAPYEPHWAFKPISTDFQDSRSISDWSLNPIDDFVQREHEKRNLRPTREALRQELARRVALDLTGLPPSYQQVLEFVADDQPDAYERYVDRLLASPQYGERWARPWLDLARYSDTNGYEKDKPRSIWLFRDWVIHALNDDMPFDQFTIEQIAGDMLPDATVDQQIATGFHRNTMMNQEGGVDPQEFRFLSVVDRVATTGTTWLGLTLGCAQCHTHKFDPISHTEYYGLFALLNNADEIDLTVVSPEFTQATREIESQISEREALLAAQFPIADGDTSSLESFDAAFNAWRRDPMQTANAWEPAIPVSATSNLPIVTILDDGSVLATGDVTKSDTFHVRYEWPTSPVVAVRLEAIADDRLPYGGPGRSSIQAGVERGGDFYLSHFEIYVVLPGESTDETNEGSHDTRVRQRLNWKTATHSFAAPNRSAADAIDGRADTSWGVAGRTAEDHWAVFELDTPLDPNRWEGAQLEFVLRHQSFYPSGLGRFRISLTADETIVPARDRPSRIDGYLASSSEELNEAQSEQLRAYFARTTPLLADARQEIDRLRESLPAAPSSMVMAARDLEHQRPTHRHHRGEYLQPREIVVPHVPSVLPPIDAEHEPNRLDFARWLTDPKHPLTARVVVNRQWYLIFGRGIVETIEDFGYQGASPTHPELLDWLAQELIEHDWSLKHIHRLIVTSATYRQSIAVRHDLLSSDPDNRWLTRGPVRRLEAELIRDTMLHASGLLTTPIGGESVFPTQPEGITLASYGPMPWIESSGADRFRRGIYTFSKRTAPYAMFSAFDAPSGESCVARRIPTNTPLQALTLLNDRFVMECAQALAKDLHASRFDADEQWIDAIFQRCLTRQPTSNERQFVQQFVDRRRDGFRRDNVSPHLIAYAGQLDAWAWSKSLGDAPWREMDRDEVRELAVWVLVARAILNLDEMITKP